VVELVFGEIEAADQGAHRTGFRADGDEGTFHFGLLCDLVASLGHLHDAHHSAAAQTDSWCGLVRQPRLHGLEPIAGDLDRVAIATGDHHLARAGFEHHGREQVAVVGMVVKRIVDGVFEFLRVGGQVDEFLGAAVNLAALVIHDALAQCTVGGALFFGHQGGGDVQSASVGFGAVLGINHLAHGFSHVFGVQDVLVGRGPQVQRFGFGGLGLRRRDEAVVFHALDDVELTRSGTFGVGERVIGRRRFGQAGEHGGFGNRDVLERFAEVGFGGRGKTIGPVAQEDLVHVDLQDLVLGEHVLEFVGQQDLVDLAGVGLLGRQVHIARHLHGDGRGALTLHAADVGNAGAQDAQIVHATVLVEASVFDGEHGILHDLGDLVDRGQVAAFFAKLAHQHAIGGVDPQRQLGPVVGQVRDVGQVGVSHHHGHTRDEHDAQHSGDRQPPQPEHQLEQPFPGACGR